MPQMSPLMWIVLWCLFTFCYLVVSVVIYYQLDCSYLRNGGDLGRLESYVFFLN